MSNKIQDEVLIHVENSVLNFILPEIMPVGRCADRRVLEASVTNSTISGASTIPADLISRDGKLIEGFDIGDFQCISMLTLLHIFIVSHIHNSVLFCG